MNSENWIILGFSWSWSNGSMSYTLSLNQETDTITIENMAPYMDNQLSTHMWGNSRITNFGLTRLFETFLEVYIHSIHIRNIHGSVTPYEELGDRRNGLWTCAHNKFWNE
jgi:hypothetical protein